MGHREQPLARRNWIVCGVLILAVGVCTRLLVGETVDAENSDQMKDLKASFANYKKWTTTTTKPFLVADNTRELCEPSTSKPKALGPHGYRYVHVYVSDNARDLFEDGKPKPGRFPPGTVIVKEKRSEEKEDKPVELGVMIKREKGFSTTTGDWQYLFVEKDGQLTLGPRLQNCELPTPKRRTIPSSGETAIRYRTSSMILQRLRLHRSSRSRAAEP